MCLQNIFLDWKIRRPVANWKEKTNFCPCELLSLLINNGTLYIPTEFINSCQTTPRGTTEQIQEPIVNQEFDATRIVNELHNIRMQAAERIEAHREAGDTYLQIGERIRELRTAMYDIMGSITLWTFHHPYLAAGAVSAIAGVFRIFHQGT
jgi:hypothetical protein